MKGMESFYKTEGWIRNWRFAFVWSSVWKDITIVWKRVGGYGSRQHQRGRESLKQLHRYIHIKPESLVAQMG